MTNETEKKFFDAFGIEPYDRYFVCSKQLERECKKICQCCELSEEVRCYPTITDRILLELIVLNNHNAPAVGNTLEELKNQVLYWCIQYKYKIYNQVRYLFGINSAKKEQ